VWTIASTGRTQARLRTVLPGALAAVAVLALAAPAAAGTGSQRPAGPTSSSPVMRLQAMPAGAVTFGRDRHRRVIVHVSAYGFTPGSSHAVDLFIPGRARMVRFRTLTAASTGSARATLSSDFAGRLRLGSVLMIRMGVAGQPGGRVIAETRPLSGSGRGPHPLMAVEIGRAGLDWGMPQGWASVSYRSHQHTLTVAVHASGLTPGRHAAHIHLGSCWSQGPVKYMLRDLVADRHGEIRLATRVFRNVTTPIPAHGWYFNLHEGNSGNILRNGQPSIWFRPLLCRDIGHRY